MYNYLIIIMLLISCSKGEEEAQSSPTDLDRRIGGMIARNDLSANTFVENETEITRLGEKLFFDNSLSGNRNISCATCHSLHSSTDLIPFSIGEGGIGVGPAREQNGARVIRRNAQQLYNLGHDQSFSFHDGRVSFINGNLSSPISLSSTTRSFLKRSLDAQTLFPILSREEMRGSSGENDLANIDDENQVLTYLLNNRILSNQEYLEAFNRAYPNENSYTPGHIGHALGSFIKNRFNVRNTPFDRYLQGDFNALTLSQKRGLTVFLGKGQCITCHNGVNLSDDDFHSVGVPHIYPTLSSNADDLGRYEVTRDQDDIYRFKTPGLRNITKSPPYMHNGAFSSLEEVISHYNNVRGSLFSYQVSSAFTSQYDESIRVDTSPVRNNLRFNSIDNGPLRRGLRMSATEQRDLRNFLDALSN